MCNCALHVHVYCMSYPDLHQWYGSNLEWLAVWISHKFEILVAAGPIWTNIGASKREKLLLELTIFENAATRGLVPWPIFMFSSVLVYFRHLKSRGVWKYSRPTLVMDMDTDWVQLSTSDWLTVIIIIMLIIIIVIFVHFNINMTNKPESTRAPGRHCWLRQELFMLWNATTDPGQ